MGEKVTIYAIDKNKKSLQKALNEGIINQGETSPLSSIMLKETDLIIFALPVKSIINVLKKIHLYLNKEILITDTGSVKYPIERIFKQYELRFTGSHPLAGSEKSGYKYSSADLFEGKLCIITGKNKKDIKIIKNLWELLGMKVVVSDARKHDKALGLTSHFIHFLSWCYLNLVIKENQKLKLKDFTTPSFKEFTRFALSSPEMWNDIFSENKEYILQYLKKFRAELDIFEKFLENDNILSLIKETGKKYREMER